MTGFFTRAPAEPDAEPDRARPDGHGPDRATMSPAVEAILAHPTEFIHPFVGHRHSAGSRDRKHYFYKYVALVLTVQALMLYLPYKMWKDMEGNR